MEWTPSDGQLCPRIRQFKVSINLDDYILNEVTSVAPSQGQRERQSGVGWDLEGGAPCLCPQPNVPAACLLGLLESGTLSHVHFSALLCFELEPRGTSQPIETSTPPRKSHQVLWHVGKGQGGQRPADRI